MNEPRILKIARRENKLGNAREFTRRPFPLTTRLAEIVLLRTKHRCSQLDGTAPVEADCAPQPTSSAAGLVHPRRDAELASMPQECAPVHVYIPSASGSAPKLCLDEENNLKWRVRVKPAAIGKGSGRRITPRGFALSVTLPLIRRAVAQPPLQPQQPTSPLTELDHQPDAARADCQPVDLQPICLPSLEELIILARDQALAKEQLPYSGKEASVLAIPASQQASVDAMELDGAAAVTLPALADQPFQMHLKQGLDVQTPALLRIKGISPQVGRHCPWHAPTPVEGVPERFAWSASPCNAAAAARPTAASEGCSSPGTSVTPIEGVPERLFKRRRVSLRPQSQWPRAAASSTPPGVDQYAARRIHDPAKGEASASIPASSRHPVEDGGLDPAEAADEVPPDHLSAAAIAAAATAAARAALERFAAAAGSPLSYCPGAAAVPLKGAVTGSPIPGRSSKDFVPGEPAEDNCSPHDIDHEGMTAADIAVAVSAAARAARQRIQGLTCATASDTPEAMAAACSASHASSDGTPAHIKIQNLAVAVEDVVQRATQAMGGLPSCPSAQSLPCSRLPPRPPSAVGRAAGTAAGAGSPTEEALGATDGQAGLGSIIHRAPPNALLFPSRTPSPMGGIQWPLILQAPEPHLMAGCISRADMVTPAAGVTLAPFAGDCVEPASSTTPRAAANHPVAAAAAPVLITTGTSPFTEEELRALGCADTKAAVTMSPAASGDQSDSAESEQSTDGSPQQGAGDSPAQGSELSLRQSVGGSPEKSRSESMGQGDCMGTEQSISESTEESGSGGMEQNHGEEGERTNAECPEQSCSRSAEQRTDSGMEQGASGRAEESSGNSHEHSSGDRSFGAQGVDGPTAHTPVGTLEQAGVGTSDPPAGLRAVELNESKILASALRLDYVRHDAEDEELAVEEVMALPDPPDEPDEPKVALRGNTERSNRSGGAGMRGQSGPARRRADAAAAAGSSRPSTQQSSESQGQKRDRRNLGIRKSMAAADLGLTVDEMGTRRSTRNRVRPLEYWRGECKCYIRKHETMPTVMAFKMRTPEPQWPLPSGKEEKAKRRARTKEKVAEEE